MGPSEAYADAAKIVYEYLIQQTPAGVNSVLYPLVAGRIYIGSHPRTFTNAGKSIVLTQEAGGWIKKNSATQKVRILGKCYGGTTTDAQGTQYDNPESARTVALALILQMHRAHAYQANSGILISATKSGGGEIVHTPPNVWPYVAEYFDVIVRTS